MAKRVTASASHIEELRGGRFKKLSTIIPMGAITSARLYHRRFPVFLALGVGLIAFAIAISIHRPRERELSKWTAIGSKVSFLLFALVRIRWIEVRSPTATIGFHPRTDDEFEHIRQLISSANISSPAPGSDS